uniref:Uncharacterized protein n=1 Tax=Denticeps clupeoides TaxID=299321 RepID=A0AAY4EVW6_9TELE
ATSCEQKSDRRRQQQQWRSSPSSLFFRESPTESHSTLPPGRRPPPDVRTGELVLSEHHRDHRSRREDDGAPTDGRVAGAGDPSCRCWDGTVRPPTLLRPGRIPADLRHPDHSAPHPGESELSLVPLLQITRLISPNHRLFLCFQFFKKKSAKDDNIYSDLAAKHDNYDQLTRRDVERGSGGRGRRAPNDDTYTSLNKPSEDTYRSIQTKDRRRNKNEQVYEGLNAATKDTYDKLQMQPLPPAR